VMFWAFGSRQCTLTDYIINRACVGTEGDAAGREWPGRSPAMLQASTGAGSAPSQPVVPTSLRQHTQWLLAAHPPHASRCAPSCLCRLARSRDGVHL
jgi:hypothetical protein